MKKFFILVSAVTLMWACGSEPANNGTDKTTDKAADKTTTEVTLSGNDTNGYQSKLQGKWTDGELTEIEFKDNTVIYTDGAVSTFAIAGDTIMYTQDMGGTKYVEKMLIVTITGDSFEETATDRSFTNKYTRVK